MYLRTKYTISYNLTFYTRWRKLRTSKKNFDIQRNTRVAPGGQFTLNYHTPSHMYLRTKYTNSYNLTFYIRWRKLRTSKLC